MGPDRDANLGHVQKHVLLVLSTRGESACTDWSAWYPLEESQVRGAMRGLGRRGLIDVAGWQHGSRGARTYKITQAGERALAGFLDTERFDEPEVDLSSAFTDEMGKTL